MYHFGGNSSLVADGGQVKTDCAAAPGQLFSAHMQHSPAFLKLVEAVRPRIREVTLEQARERLRLNPRAILVDVREDNEWNDGHAADAVHLGKGIFERDLEKTAPDPASEIILYCGGGYRSALAADAAQQMGYKNVFSLIGGYKAMTAANWPMKKG
jgi:rhodanese-related sulfurtransferase